MSIELKLLELGYKPLLFYSPTHYYTKFVTKYSCIKFTVENGKITNCDYEIIARKIPKEQQIIRMTINQLQKDLEVLKECI